MCSIRHPLVCGATDRRAMESARASSPPLRVCATARVCLLIVCAWSALVASPRAQDREDDAREEVFERIDPYTRAEPKALDRAGYISLGPFPLAEGIKTGDVEETIGAGRVLWVETAHFKLGSTLRTYKLRGDIREEKTLKLELERLSKRLEKPATLSQGRLDP